MTRAERRRAIAAGIVVSAAAQPSAEVETVADKSAEMQPVDVQPVEAPAPSVPVLTRRAARAALATPTEPFQWTALADDGAAGPEVTVHVVDTDPVETDAAATADPASLHERADEEVDEPHRRLVDADDEDEFAAAARLFRFTGETPIIREPVRVEPVPASAHVVTPRRAKHVMRRVTAAGSSVVVMALAGVLAVSLTTSPRAVAVAAPASADAASAGQLPGDVQFEEDDIQAFVAPEEVENTALDRDEKYSSVTIAEIASDEGIQNFSNVFLNDPNAAIQWPFDVGVPMSYGYGMRSGRLHEGIDFTPGAGAPIQAIADGVVRIATESGGAYGVTVVIDHVIDGDLISSRYAHMQYGSLQVEPGQEVKVGDPIGRVGATGRAYGAHLHFELHDASGDSFDPWPWMVEHTGN